MDARQDEIAEGDQEKAGGAYETDTTAKKEKVAGRRRPGASRCSR